MTQPILKLHTDLSQRVVIDTNAMLWQPSPSPGVWRKRLELLGEVESGRVTSVVRYDPGSSFSEHPHPDGEEILVLSGIFSDHTGNYAAGAYLLNPDGFVHAPFSKEGCTLFVKLRQCPGTTRHTIKLNTSDRPWAPTSLSGIDIKPLYAQVGFPERMRLERWQPGAYASSHTHRGIEEVFVLDGIWADEQGQYPAGTWLRYPLGSQHTPTSKEGCILYIREVRSLS